MRKILTKNENKTINLRNIISFALKVAAAQRRRIYQIEPEISYLLHKPAVKNILVELLSNLEQIESTNQEDVSPTLIKLKQELAPVFALLDNGINPTHQESKLICTHLHNIRQRG